MKTLLRALLLLHLRRPAGLWIALSLVTALFAWGALRVERRLDLMSLLPTEHPVVKASLEAGVGRQELLWVAAEGTPEDVETREAWAERLVETLLDLDGVPLNGMSGEGRLSGPLPVPEPRGASLWPPLLAAGSLREGDGAVARLVTEQVYALAPALLGNRLAPLQDPQDLERRFRETARHLGSPDPVRAYRAQLDPMDLLGLVPESNDTLGRADLAARGFPLKMRLGYLVTKDARFVLVPLVLDFPSGDAQATGRLLTWLGQGAQGPLPARSSLAAVEGALARGPDRSFPLQATGAHAVAYWESQRLTREVVVSLVSSFILIGLVYWIGFRTLSGYGFVVIPLLLGMLWALGLVGWGLGKLNLMAAAFGAVLLGVGDDVGILLFSRYQDERRAGRSKALALRAALLGTGPGVIAGATATSLAFLACAFTPFPGLRDLGITAGLGLLACTAASFLLLPLLMVTFDRGQGPFAPREERRRPEARTVRWKPLLALTLVAGSALGIPRMTWEEDLRRFRQQGNPALKLQEVLGKVLGAGLQPLAIQIPLDDPERLPHRWNRIVEPLRKEGLPLPLWSSLDPDLRLKLGSARWTAAALEAAARAGLDPSALERPLNALRASVADPGAVPASLRALLPDPRLSPLPEPWSLARWFRSSPANSAETVPSLTLPLRLPEAAQDRVEPAVMEAGARMVGTRPLFRAVKAVARDAIQQAVLLAAGGVLLVVGIFGRRWRFALLTIVPVAASQVGVLGTLGWSGEPLTFLSLVAIPIALGVSMDTAMNLLHRARLEPGASRKVARVNAVCAGTTLAGFGGLVFSGYRGLQGLGLAALGGTALALLASQWLLPWLLEKWPLRRERP